MYGADAMNDDHYFNFLSPEINEELKKLSYKYLSSISQWDNLQKEIKDSIYWDTLLEKIKYPNPRYKAHIPEGILQEAISKGKQRKLYKIINDYKATGRHLINPIIYINGIPYDTRKFWDCADLPFDKPVNNGSKMYFSHVNPRTKVQIREPKPLCEYILIDEIKQPENMPALKMRDLESGE
jgi:hypothetical protein